MRRFLLALALAPALLLGACTSLQDVVNSIVANAKLICNVAVSATDIAAALAGTDPNVIVISQVVNSICAQYKAQVSPTEPHPKAAANTCVNVTVNGKPVKVCSL